jgi:4-amino-4-deoxychorismate lyase
VSDAPRYVTVLTRGFSGPEVRRQDPSKALLSAFDLAATRGDGAFEALLVRDGRVVGRHRHLERLGRSAAALGISGPGPDAWAALVDDLVEQWTARPTGPEAVLKLVLTRGDEGRPGPVTAYGTVAALDPALPRQRADGVHLVVLCLGVPAWGRRLTPWLLPGVKSLSYAVNQAAKREAAARGADDALFTTLEGLVLEGPSSTLLWREGRHLCTTPMNYGVLPGTTQAEVFDRCGELGLRGAERGRSVREVVRSDGAWMCSSTRGVAAVRSIDGEEVSQDPALTAALQELSGVPAPVAARSAA